MANLQVKFYHALEVKDDAVARVAQVCFYTFQTFPLESVDRKTETERVYSL